MEQTAHLQHAADDDLTLNESSSLLIPSNGYLDVTMRPQLQPTTPSNNQPRLHLCFPIIPSDAVGSHDMECSFIYSEASIRPVHCGRPTDRGRISAPSDLQAQTGADQTAAYMFSTTPIEFSLEEPGQVNTVVPSTPSDGSLQCHTTPDFVQSPRAHSQQSHPGLQCRWEDCSSSTTFRREADLLRHLKTVHVSPKAFPCPELGCNKAFGRTDHLRAHRRNCHGK
ncbi:hypothetical protein BJX63DRAFT_139377 [Aspergillus granulosus]|uniref:C2H2-type domain-containing protein n=1 Tax=Aspergillus granulosus TaxID=176169 RepID=A0ABR4GTV1_9EURO